MGTTINTANGTVSGAGLCTITATAPASNNYTAASLTQAFNITAAPLTVAANSFSVVYGQPLPPLNPVLGTTYSLSGFVNSDSPTNGAVTGTPALATTAAPLSSPHAYPITVSTGSLAAANYSFYFVGGTLTIAPATTATTLVSSSPGNASNFMQQVTFTATVVDNAPGSLGAAPTGTVSFYNNGVLIGQPANLAPLPCTTPPCASQAMVSTTTLATGNNPITATYSGDANYSQSTASGLTLIVTPVAIVSLNPSSLAFGNTNVGKSSSAPVTLMNTGDANLSLSSIQVTGPNMADFTASSNCPSSLGYTSGSNSCTITVKFTPSQTGVETATLQITDNADNTPGSQQFVSLTGSGLTSINGTSVYTDAIFSTSNGCGAITVSSGSSVNSFNSLQGYTASQQNSGGNVGTNGNLTLGSGGTIYGSAAADVLTTGKCSATSVTGLTTSSGGSVTGGLVALNGPVNYPAPPAPNPAPPTTSQTISGSCPSGMTGCSNTGSKAVTLAPGRYGNVAANNGTTVHILAGTYFFNSLKISGGSVLHVDSGPVVVNLAGASLTGGTPVLDFTGGGMENPGGIPGNLQFIYGGTQGLNLAGGVNAYAAVYAPNAPVNLGKGTDFFGSITGSTVNSTSGTAIHYDTNLPNIAQGSTIWFAAVVNNLKGLPANQQVKLYMTNGSISFTANNTQYTVPVPNAVVTLNSSISGSKSTVYDLTNTRWNTNIASTNLTGNTFVTGVAFQVPVAFPAGIQNVTWSGAFSTDTPGITLQWQWNAQVYTQFSQTYATSTSNNVLGVNAEDGSADAFGTDPAGTPETYKPNATFGATDGYFSAASGVVPTVAQVSVAPSSLSFGTVNVGQTSASMAATLTNNYGSAFTISNIAISGTNANDFSIVSNTCPLTAGGFTSSCTITVTFKPSYTTLESAKIVITDTANNSPQTVYVSGTGQ
ncbi:MAG TPA: choice-of-anchor D domain-containing protein [Acidobacteriaceae bacterium]|nr:choice-of-anchor D domain-containing protein [Acidobacteriaceae bacterium]